MHRLFAAFLLVTAVFGGITIVTMVGVVALGSCGIRLIAFGKLERFTHALAGGTILLAGGRYRMLRTLHISTDGVTLRGSGGDRNLADGGNRGTG
jgi:hypothetical protein